MNQNNIFDKYEIIGHYTKKYLDRHKEVLNVNATILITGETGTGKELVARWIHFNDRKRLEKPFVKITIPNIGENIFESEVFGYEKGAFTGAIVSKKGLIEVAEDGTVFFDEIENASPAIQSKLLQLLEDRIYRKVGDTSYKQTNARFVVATNKDLYEEVIKNNFRSDLFYRLAVLEIKIPPLRERGKDIIEISNHYIKKFSGETGKKIAPLGEKAFSQMSDYPWPGNIRELKNFIEKAVVFSKNEEIDLTLIPKSIILSFQDSFNYSYKEYMQQKELELLKKALLQCNGNIEQTAKLINMSVPFVYKKLREFEIHV
ncbi:MAG: sigma 54-interacting transcriptional regulator [Clostridia bacterium]|nr:sigma 54-interacting transcriptional regulator [Clostridia bacterium]